MMGLIWGGVSGIWTEQIALDRTITRKILACEWVQRATSRKARSMRSGMDELNDNVEVDMQFVETGSGRT